VLPESDRRPPKIPSLPKNGFCLSSFGGALSGEGKDVSRAFHRLRLAAALAALLLALLPSPSWAAVRITFYSKEFGASFPHAFVTLEGTLDRDGRRISEDYGFSAKTISPAILWGKVKGEVITDHTPSYVAASDRHFSLALSDAEYDAVMATVARWRGRAQPSYDLDRQNCVHFVADIAAGIGFRPQSRKGLMKKPRSFLESLTEANRSWLLARGAVIHRGASAAGRPAA
jgi:hypothetical protein